MGDYVNNRAQNIIGWGTAALLIGANAVFFAMSLAGAS
jgi:Mn2+/Fe2+ NRAMP family transporter